MTQPRQKQETAQACLPQAQPYKSKALPSGFAYLPAGLTLVLASSCALLRPKPVEYEPMTLPSGVVVLDLVVPDKGPAVALGDRVGIEYDLFLDNGEDGEMVDSTSLRGRPARFEVGTGEVPKGVEEGILGLRLFGQRRIIVPPQVGYGDAGLPPRIPPQATLRFDVELVELEPQSLGGALGGALEGQPGEKRVEEPAGTESEDPPEMGQGPDDGASNP